MINQKKNTVKRQILFDALALKIGTAVTNILQKQEWAFEPLELLLNNPNEISFYLADGHKYVHTNLAYYPNIITGLCLSLEMFVHPETAAQASGIERYPTPVISKYRDCKYMSSRCAPCSIPEITQSPEQESISDPKQE